MNKTKTVIFVLIIIFGICCLAKSSFAACGGSYSGSSPGTITASDCTQECVQLAFNAATRAGDTVVLPACSGANAGHWTVPISWTAPMNSTLRGAGTSATGGGDQTVIMDDIIGNPNTVPLSFGVTDNGSYSTPTFRMTGITIQGGSGDTKPIRCIKNMF